MSNAPGPRRRRRGGLKLPRSAWPQMCAFAATPGLDDTLVEQAVRVATDDLARRLAGVTRRSEIRAVAVDADEADAVLADLNIDPSAQPDLRAFCAEHPAGRLVVAWADYQPNVRATTVFGG